MKRARRHLPPPVLEYMGKHPLLAVTARNLTVDADNIERLANPKNTEVRGIVADLRRVANFYHRARCER